MSQLTIVNKSQLFAAATAITAVGLLTVAPPAQARPTLPFPLAPACSQWGFPGSFSLKQSNGDTVEFNATGPAASGSATATGGGNGPLNGYVTGGITGDKLDFSIDWGIVFHEASVGHYLGVVGNDGFAHGNTADVFGTAGNAHWDSTVALVCSTPVVSPPPPAAAPPQNPLLSEPATEVPNRRTVPPAAPAVPAAGVATVSSDVDVYDAPGGKGNKIGILRSGRQVTLVATCKPNDWCNVVIPELSGGSGWVWDQFLQF